MSPTDSRAEPPGPPGHASAKPRTRTGTIRAAGCVLWRRAPGGDGVEICLVHRPRYDDWSFPKGKLKRGEEPLAAAVREVLEETGHHCTPGTRLPTARYLVDGRPKEVAYWAAEAADGAFEANDEVDRLLWLTPGAARARLTQPRDVQQLTALLDTLAAP
ncbi:NUDIX hydrolase [Streptomyces sp. C11-1]|uniref:NUDIX hydrolase n=1 Tax=Streptomyces durocortorensis TaxID=2811104 RepID=A0ABY9VX78_9ACTN|nr:NUDIX hydrolase [Streptomyces durocortorensis]WNF28512.1 NUDIX hydrolase [Streptomyces durocortorensis]